MRQITSTVVSLLIILIGAPLYAVLMAAAGGEIHSLKDWPVALYHGEDCWRLGGYFWRVLLGESLRS
jgi:hypothetical protein